MNQNQIEIPVIILFWEKVIGHIFDITSKFPKSSRFTFSSRIDNKALDIFEFLNCARFEKGKERQLLLGKADTSLLLLRNLLRLSFDRKFIAKKSFEYIIRLCDEAGKMLGGWIKKEHEKEESSL